MAEVLTVSGPAERFQAILEKMARETSGSKELVISDRNGLPVASLRRGPKTAPATASATMVLAAAQNVAFNLGLEGQPNVQIEGPGWKVIVWPLGAGLSLLGVFDENVNLGYVRMAVQHRMTELKEILDELA